MFIIKNLFLNPFLPISNLNVNVRRSWPFPCPVPVDGRALPPPPAPGGMGAGMLCHQHTLGSGGPSAPPSPAPCLLLRCSGGFICALRDGGGGRISEKSCIFLTWGRAQPSHGCSDGVGTCPGCGEAETRLSLPLPFTLAPTLFASFLACHPPARAVTEMAIRAN